MRLSDAEALSGIKVLDLSGRVSTRTVTSQCSRAAVLKRLQTPSPQGSDVPIPHSETVEAQ
jgi:hypothetical protein